MGGRLEIHTEAMIQNGSDIDTQSISGEIGAFMQITHTDQSHSEDNSFGISTGGDFSFNHHSCDSQTVNQATELHVKDAINGKAPDEFVVHHLVSIGGKIISDGVNNLNPDSVTATAVEEHCTSSGFSVCGNFNNYLTSDTQVNHLIPRNDQSLQITTTNFAANGSDYEAEVNPVVYGAAGTHLTSQHTQGYVETHSEDGRQVEKDTHYDYRFELPHIDPETQQQMDKNRQWVKSKALEMEQKVQKAVSDFWGPADRPTPDEPNSFYHRKYYPGTDNTESTTSTSTNASDKKEAKESLEPWQEKAAGYYDQLEEEDTSSSRDDTRVSRDDEQEAYLEGKRAAATGILPEKYR